MKKCTVIGGGAMGRQIALNTAIHGYDVVVCESFPAALASLESWKEEYLAGRVAKGRMTQEQVDAVKARFSVTEDSSVIIHSCSNVKEPVRQGMWGIFEVFADTMVICTMTALVILTGGLVDLSTGALADGLTDATLVSATFGNVFGKVGEMFVAVAILLFAFTTVLGWSQYGSKAVEYLGGKRAKQCYQVFFVLLIMSGALMTSSLAWDISDTFNGLMMIPNLIGVIALSGQVRKITQNYVDRKFRNKNVAPLLSYHARIQQQMAQEE